MLDNFQIGGTITLTHENRTSADSLATATSMTATIYGPDGSVYQAATAMTEGGTGIYSLNVATNASDSAGCYRVAYTTVYSGTTKIAQDYFTLSTGGSPLVSWSVATLADQLRAEMDVNPDAGGGSLPDRIAKRVRDKGIWLFNHMDWLFRKTPGTLSVAAGDSDIALPADFKELDGDKMRVTDNAAWRLLWTEDASYFQRAKDSMGSTATGTPRIALCYYTGGAWRAKIWPEADDDYTYPYWYIRCSPWSTSSPIADNIALSPTYWPEDFDEGWYNLCAYSLYSRFRADDSWKGFKSEFEKWLKDHVSENNETIASGLEPIRDAMNDFAHTAMGCAGWNPPGGYVKWYGST